MFGYEFYIDPSRCIGCQACVNACAECETHRGTPMIHVDFLDRANTIATVPSVKDRVIEIDCENLGVNKEQVTEKTSFIEDVGADSLDIVELIMELEEEFEINIPDEQAEKIKTVGEAIEYIEREIAKK